MSEIWAPCVGWETGYLVSSQGRVWSRPRPGTKGGLLNPYMRPDGCLHVTLCRGRTHSSPSIHVLMCNAFLGPRPEKMYACHIDGVRTNNVLTNLRWGTHYAKGRIVEPLEVIEEAVMDIADEAINEAVEAIAEALMPEGVVHAVAGLVEGSTASGE